MREEWEIESLHFLVYPFFFLSFLRSFPIFFSGARHLRHANQLFFLVIKYLSFAETMDRYLPLDLPSGDFNVRPHSWNSSPRKHGHARSDTNSRISNNYPFVRMGFEKRGRSKDHVNWLKFCQVLGGGMAREAILVG